MSRVDTHILDLAEKLRGDIDKALTKRGETQTKLAELNHEIHTLMTDLDEVRQVIVDRNITDYRAQPFLVTETP